jgi:transketolase
METAVPATAPASLDALAIRTIRFLAIDMVEAAKSGHPGAPLGQAPMAYTLWSRHLRFDPAAPDWWNRDRFVLSCGHASALIYSLLHLFGYDLPMAELERFRQLDSKTPGHPEHGHTVGVETTTGPLGQGFGNAVGMAIAREMMAARFNRPGLELFDYRIWAIASDGDLMEGVASEAASLAGHLGLGSLNVLYDDNDISIDGPTSLSFGEDVAARFAAYGWHVQKLADGNDVEAIDRALQAAAAVTDRPSLIAVKTTIGFGSPHKQGTSEAHGEPLGPAEAKATKEALGGPVEPTFHVSDEARAVFAAQRARGERTHRNWVDAWNRYRSAHAAETRELERRFARRLPDGWRDALPTFGPADAMASREASGKVLTALAPIVPELVGGSADLTPSNKTLAKGESDFSRADRGGRYLRFGVREHAMGAAMNGIALSGALRPFGGTFLIFSDYMRPSIRLAAVMKQPAIYVFTHDSIFLGEDGPTHQPVSQLASLRSIPGLVTLRPADAQETVAAWEIALTRTDGPTALALSRQKLQPLPVDAARVREGVARGGYVVADKPGATVAILATGSELGIALAAHQTLQGQGVATRVVSLPSWELFALQPESYRQAVLPDAIGHRLVVEAGSSFGWDRFRGPGRFAHLTQDGFGASAPAADLAKAFGFTADEVTKRVLALAPR